MNILNSLLLFLILLTSTIVTARGSNKEGDWYEKNRLKRNVCRETSRKDGIRSADAGFGRNPYQLRWYEKSRLKAECLKPEAGGDRRNVSYCWFWEGMKSWFHRTSISWFPGKTKEWTLGEVTAYCDNYFTCMYNTDCYKDYLLYQTLDRCTTDAFNIGPMSFCTEKLEKQVENSPNDVAECTKSYLKDNPPQNITCQWVRDIGNCLVPDITKNCDPKVLSMFKEHQDLRLYNLGCDGKLKFKDLDLNEGILTSTDNEDNDKNGTDINMNI